MRPPASYDVNFLQNLLLSEKMGGGALSGEDRTIWGMLKTAFEEATEPKTDLVTILPANQEDPFSKWFTHTDFQKYLASRWFERRHPPDCKQVVYENHRLLQVTQVITSSLAPMLPVLSINVLFLVKSSPARLGIIAGFNLSLSIMLVAFTKATRAEVFSVCAA